MPEVTDVDLTPPENPSPFHGRHVAVISAHCDDEILGIGGQLATMRRVSVIHLTDSAPSNRTARAHGFPDRRCYHDARQHELQRALAQAAPDTERHCFNLNLRDGGASFQMHEASAGIARLLRTLQPDIIVSQPYEGGHPDHDTVALATRTALRSSRLTVPLWEMTAYHRVAGEMNMGGFLPAAGHSVVRVPLDRDSRARKAAALACFVSQRDVVNLFPLDWEDFRLAPHYDFQQPPHAGRLNYEGRRRAMSSRLWRSLAARANDRALSSRLLHGCRTILWRCWLST